MAGGRAGGFALNAQTQRGQAVKKRDGIDKLPSVGKRWAVVIGVDEYDDPNINRLSGAVNDADAGWWANLEKHNAKVVQCRANRFGFCFFAFADDGCADCSDFYSITTVNDQR